MSERKRERYVEKNFCVYRLGVYNAKAWIIQSLTVENAWSPRRVPRDGFVLSRRPGSRAPPFLATHSFLVALAIERLNQEIIMKDFILDLRRAKPQVRLGMLLAGRPAHCRVAPSPTGFFHVGTARCALHNALAAKASGGSFLLRLDDTDAARNDDAHVDLIHDCLGRLGLKPDRFARQSDRSLRHAQVGKALLDSGLAWRDANGSVRLSDSAVDALPQSFFDLAAGDVPISATSRDQCRGLTLLRPDGSATYPLASVVDDVDFGINLVLRGADHLSNTPKQLAIALAMGRSGMDDGAAFADSVVFAHVGLITKDGKKISKRDGGSSLLDALAGSSSAAVVHWALRLGWSHPDSTFDRDWPTIGLGGDMPRLFAQGRIKSSNCDVSLAKLHSLSKVYAAGAPRL